MANKAALEKRVSSRRKMVLPLKTRGADTAASAVHTLNISTSGAKLGALREPVNSGDILILQRKHKRIKCRVVWVRDMGRGETHVEVELLGSETDFWGLGLEDAFSVVCTLVR